MRKAKTEIKIEPYPKGGWYVVERVGGKVWWQSSNYQSIELAEVRMKERKELKDNVAKLLDKKLAKRLKPRNGLATKPTVKKREYNARQRYLALFDEYSKQRKKQHKSKRKNEFKLSDIRELFGMQATTVDRAISNGQIKSTIGKTLSKGRWVRLFSYDDIKLYFEYLRGLQNGKPTSTMGTQNVQ
jgi:hypothetical protein